MPPIKITSKEVKWALLWGTLMVLLTTLPYLVGWFTSDETQQFEGLLISTADARSYLAKMRQGADGQWLWTLTYTHETHSGGPFYFFYLGLGKVCRALGLSLISGYHIARVASGLFLSWTLYYTLSNFVQTVAHRKLAYFLMLFGGGLGWLWLLLGFETGLWKMPVDLWVPDGYAWYATLIGPHYAFSHALLLLAITSGARFVQNGQLADWWQTTLWLTLSVLMHPYSVLIIALLMGLWLLIQKWGNWALILKRGLQSAATILPSAPYMLWVAWLFLRHPAFHAWAEQGLNPSPAPLHYLLGYAPFLILIGCLPLRAQTRAATHPQIAIWAIGGALALYIPLSAQRRFIEGLEFPLAILAAAGLCNLYHWLHLKRGWKRILLTLTLGLTTMTMLTLLLGATLTVLNPTPQFFLQRGETQLYTWLAEHTSRDDVVLASMLTSSRLPAQASLRVVWGVAPETIDSAHKEARVIHFYQATHPAEATALLCDWEITYVVWGPQEQDLGTFDPHSLDFLMLSGQWNDWSLWEVDPNLCAP